MRTNITPAKPSGSSEAEYAFQQYLRISQEARVAALRARREAINAFWTALSHAIQGMLHRGTTFYHPMTADPVAHNTKE
jgi:hypothetical protein